MKNRFENPCVFQCHFFRDLEWIWVGFWEGLGDLWEDLLALFSNILRHVTDDMSRRHFGGVWGGFSRGLGRDLGGSGGLLDAFGRSEDAF